MTEIYLEEVKREESKDPLKKNAYDPKDDEHGGRDHGLGGKTTGRGIIKDGDAPAKEPKTLEKSNSNS